MSFTSGVDMLPGSVREEIPPNRAISPCQLTATRTNLGNALVYGLRQDLGISSVQYSTALTMFFVAYILFDIPSNLLLKKLTPRIFRIASPFLLFPCTGSRANQNTSICSNVNVWFDNSLHGVCSELCWVAKLAPASRYCRIRYTSRVCLSREFLVHAERRSQAIFFLLECDQSLQCIRWASRGRDWQA